MTETLFVIVRGRMMSGVSFPEAPACPEVRTCRTRADGGVADHPITPELVATVDRRPARLGHQLPNRLATVTATLSV